MADDKEKKDGGGGGSQDVESTIWTILIIVFVVYLLWNLVKSIYFNIHNYAVTELSYDSAFRRLLADPSLRNIRRLGETSFIGSVISTLIISIRYGLYLLGIVLLYFAYRFYKKTKAITEEESVPVVKPPIGYIPEENESQKRWKKIEEHSQSENSSDWRLAILEADIILDEILDINGYKGDTIGDKLKAVERSDMDTLDLAWEAHKIRNAIAHQGQSFVLTSRETRRVIDLYKQVFREFDFI